MYAVDYLDCQLAHETVAAAADKDKDRVVLGDGLPLVGGGHLNNTSRVGLEITISFCCRVFTDRGQNCSTPRKRARRAELLETVYFV